MQPKEISCDGKVYASLIEFSNSYSLHPSTTGRRLRDGWTPEESAGLVEKNWLGKEKIVDSQRVINDYKYFIDGRR